MSQEKPLTDSPFLIDAKMTIDALDALEKAGHADSLVAESVREFGDRLWGKMSEADRDEVRAHSAHLANDAASTSDNPVGVDCKVTIVGEDGIEREIVVGPPLGWFTNDPTKSPFVKLAPREPESDEPVIAGSAS